MLPDIKNEDLENDLKVSIRLHRVKILNEIAKLQSNKENVSITSIQAKSPPIVKSQKAIISPVGNNCTKNSSAKEESKINEKHTNSFHEITLNECAPPSCFTIKCIEGITEKTEYKLSENPISIGRHSTLNEIVLGESFVSRKHCQLCIDLSKCFVQDNGSMTGTFVLAHTPLKLREGMLIQLGGTEFQVLSMSLTELQIYVYEGPSKVKKINVTKEGIKIGRDISNEVSIPEDEQLSNTHATIYAKDSAFFIKDECSTNKIWERLSAEGSKSSPYELQNEDILKVGSSLFSIQDSSKASIPQKKHISSSSPQMNATPHEDASLCKICFSNASNAVLIPCGHNMSCLMCASKLKTCPICRIDILHFIKLYR